MDSPRDILVAARYAMVRVGWKPSVHNVGELGKWKLGII